MQERHTSSLRQSNQGTKNITPTPPPLIPTVEGGKRKDAEQLKDVKDPSRTNRKVTSKMEYFFVCSITFIKQSSVAISLKPIEIRKMG